ncbi:MAG: DUF2125 domain-containing protein [Rhodobacteraceae bacterium]|nr:DUF2125 domain-containing protein [Paracoccaceae bacterium]
MRIILWLVALMTALYCGYWVLASRGLRSGLETALAEMRAAGTGDVTALEVGGFPYRFDVALTEPRVTNPDGSVAWSAPGLDVHALAYQPQKVIAIFPMMQRLRIGRETVTVTSADLMASARAGVATNLPLQSAESVGHAVALTSDAGWGLVIEELRAATRLAGAPEAQQIGIEARGLTLAGLPADLITAGGALPASGERLYLDATLVLDRPVDRETPVTGVRIRSADVRSLALDWGPAGLTGSGTLTLDAAGIPEGRLELSLRNWRAVLRLTTALGLVRPESAPTIERALEGLSLLGGSVDVLTLPLVFQSGRMSLGPVPLGPAPRF